MDRYSRHFNLPDFTPGSQELLKQAYAVVIGAGGLGVPVLQYIIAAGVGRVLIIDDDQVSISNLQRQVIYKEKDLGESKARLAAERLSELNSEVQIAYAEQRLTKENIQELLQDLPDVILDASDNFKTRYLVDEFAFYNGVPLVYGAIHRYEGQMAVFNHKGSCRYSDLFPEAPEDGTVENCDINGVLGPVAGNIGCLMANECIKILTGIGNVQSDALIIMNFDDLSMHKMRLPKGKDHIHLGDRTTPIYHSISSKDLRNAIVDRENIHLLDVRSRHEFAALSIEGSVNIPKEEILDRLEEIPRDIEVVVICNIGQSSMNVIRYLQNELKFSNLINLNGGIFSYFRENHIH